MKLEHIAIWTNQLEIMRTFYVTYFEATANNKYHNVKKGVESYFLGFEGGSRIELMQMPELKTGWEDNHMIGLHHIAFQTKNRKTVDELTDKIVASGYSLRSQPRETGDGYYESSIYDPDGNVVEITA
ncbi:MAG: VOC family protein [Vallitaleaceae bacterium]|jgi:lactoylglutathione lyase|nr:VOC family protein [Vallitaleaceae bacterium]